MVDDKSKTGGQDRSRMADEPEIRLDDLADRLPDQDPAVLAIIRELYIALEKLHASPELLALVGGWRDTATDAETLEQRSIGPAQSSTPSSLRPTTDLISRPTWLAMLHGSNTTSTISTSACLILDLT